MSVEAHGVPRRHATRSWKISPAPPTVVGQIRAVWRYRHLFVPLATNVLFDKYRGAILGITWMAIIPLMMAIPAVYVVGNMFGISVDPLPLPLFILVGLAAWMLFRRSLQFMTRGLGKASSVLERIYAPPLLLMIANISPALFQCGVILSIVIGLMGYYAIQGTYFVEIGWHVLVAIPAAGMIVMAALAVACVTSILNVFARDTWLALRYGLGAWMLATPVVYPIEVIPDAYRWLMYLNPLTVPVELFRFGLLGYGHIPPLYLALGIAELVVLFLCGIWFFSRLQNRVFDHL